MASDAGAGAGAGSAYHPERRHGYHALSVLRVVRETDDASSLVLEVPDRLRDAFTYQPGQFCTFRVRIDGDEHLRSYSMSSAPETDPDLTVTVKRVPGGLVSNWLLDHVLAGDVLETTRPAGVFCLRETEAPVVAFCGGSGVTPVMSITKRALVSTRRPVTVVYANRHPDSVIFAPALADLLARHPDRLRVIHHFDSQSGFMDAASVGCVASGAPGAHFYICGPAPFMDMVETALLDLGVDPGRVFIERFSVPSSTPATDEARGAGTSAPEAVTIIIKGRATVASYHQGDTVLETARRAALNPPSSCEAGNCATCMARLTQGTASMRVNNALTPEEVEEGWILTCQAVPSSREATVEYESW